MPGVLGIGGAWGLPEEHSTPENRGFGSRRGSFRWHERGQKANRPTSAGSWWNGLGERSAIEHRSAESTIIETVGAIEVEWQFRS